MSTNARLRAKLSNNSFMKPVYVHWDGYPSYMLPILNDQYNSDDKVEELMMLGNLSVLDKKVKPDEGEEHSFDNPAKDTVIAYHRDRGDDKDFWSDRRLYNYIYNDGVWKTE